MKGIRHRNILTQVAVLVCLAACLSEEKQYDGFIPRPRSDVNVSGHVGDPLIANASIVISSADGESLANLKAGDAGRYAEDVQAPVGHYPLFIEAKGGESIVTRRAPALVLRGAVLAKDSDAVANANPFSTLAIKVAENLNGGATVANLQRGEIIVTESISSGLDALAASGPMSTRIDDTNVAEMVMASATLSEIFIRTRSALVAAGVDLDVEDVIDAIAADLIDGVIEGSGGAAAEARIAATTNAVIAQVLAESMTAELRVDDFHATSALNSAVERASSGSASPALAELTPNDRMVAEWQNSVYAIAAVSNDPVVLEIATNAGSVTAGMYPDDVWAMLPRGWRGALADAARDIAAGDMGTVSAVNAAARNGDRDFGAANRAPTISGTPPDSVKVGDPYEFTPIASDLDGDSLSFEISNRPSWLDFDKSTGRLSGTPAAADEGLHASIRITVSDGLSTNRIGPFSITVADKDTAPSIGGNPDTRVTAGTRYRFVPDASDPDNDNLAFSITHKPAWASFDITSGALTGTPQTEDIGKYRNIVISVSDGSFTAKLAPFSIEVLAADTEVGSASLQWTPPTLNSDGSVLRNLAGYRVYWRSQAGKFNNSMIISNPGVSRVVIDDLAPGNYDFAVTAFNKNGGESRFSETIRKIVD